MRESYSSASGKRTLDVGCKRPMSRSIISHQLPVDLILACARLRICTIVNSGYSRLARTHKGVLDFFTIGHVDACSTCLRCAPHRILNVDTPRWAGVPSAQYWSVCARTVNQVYGPVYGTGLRSGLRYRKPRP